MSHFEHEISVITQLIYSNCIPFEFGAHDIYSFNFRWFMLFSSISRIDTQKRANEGDCEMQQTLTDTGHEVHDTKNLTSVIYEIYYPSVSSLRSFLQWDFISTKMTTDKQRAVRMSTEIYENKVRFRRKDKYRPYSDYTFQTQTPTLH